MGARGLAGTAVLGAAAALAALAPAAHGRTIGSAAIPAGASPGTCPGEGIVVFQLAGSDPGWTVPRDGRLMSWSMESVLAEEGAPVSLVVLRPGPVTRTIVAVDTRRMPSLPPLAMGEISFRATTPITVRADDQLAISGSEEGAVCAWSGGAVGSGHRLALGRATPSLIPDALVALEGESPAGFRLNLAAEVADEGDLRVTAAAAGPAGVLPGALAQLSATIANAGPYADDATVTTELPAGLKVETAVVGGGACTVAGQQVTCTVPQLAAGASVPLVVLATPAAAGSYAATFGAAGFLAELAPADNGATATLTVAAPPSGERPVPPPAPRCIVPSLSGTPLAVARRLLPQLRCSVGKVTKARSKKVAKGAVISTRPRRGEHAAGTAVALVVSSGKPVRRAARRPAKTPARRRSARR